MKKMFAEDSLEEVKTILGWDIYFCDLKSALTKDKFEEQSKDIEEILESGETSIKELDAVIGRNGYTCQVFKL